MSMSPLGPCGCSPLGPGPSPTPSAIISPSMPLGWPVGRPLSPMCCYAQPNKQLEHLYLFGMTAASVTGATASFAKHVTSTSSPPVLPLQRGSGQFGDAVVDPWLMMGTWRLVDIKVVCAACAVTQGTVGADPRLQVRLYQVNIASNTLIATLDLPCISGLASIGVSDNITGRTELIYFAQHSFSPPVKPDPFTFLGWQFQNVATDNEKINSVAICSSALVFEGNY
jgi:hypothetical protein